MRENSNRTLTAAQCEFSWPLHESTDSTPRCSEHAVSGCLYIHADGTWGRNGSTDALMHRENLQHYPRLLEALRSSGRVRSVLDAGACDGFSTVLFARALPEATVVAVEPVVDNFNLMVRNVASLQPRVRLLRAALWSRSATMSVVPANHWGAWAHRIEVHALARRPSGAAEEMPAVTVDRLLAMACLPAFDFVKLDIEGAESSVLAPGSGFESWLCRAAYFYMEVHPKNHDRRRNRTNIALELSASALLACNMTLFTLPTLRHPVLRQAREYVYFACGTKVPHDECVATCAAWRRGSRYACREIVELSDYRGDGAPRHAPPAATAATTPAESAACGNQACGCRAAVGSLLSTNLGTFSVAGSCRTDRATLCGMAVQIRPAQERWVRELPTRANDDPAWRAYLSSLYVDGVVVNLTRLNFFWGSCPGRRTFAVAWACKCQRAPLLFAPLLDAALSPRLVAKVAPSLPAGCMQNVRCQWETLGDALAPHLPALRFPGFFVAPPGSMSWAGFVKHLRTNSTARQVPDDTWVEVFRIARHDDKPGEQADGQTSVGQVWFWAAQGVHDAAFRHSARTHARLAVCLSPVGRLPGSGIWWNSGRSLRVARSPGCAAAAARGFDSIQQDGLYGYELIDCLRSARQLGLPSAQRSWTRACPPPSVELRVGLPPAAERFAPALASTDRAGQMCRCMCDDAHEHLSCA